MVSLIEFFDGDSVVVVVVVVVAAVGAGVVVEDDMTDDADAGRADEALWL